MRWWVVLALAGCQFSPQELLPGGSVDAALGDAPSSDGNLADAPLPDSACPSTCSGDELHSCAGDLLETCALGCVPGPEAHRL